MSHPALRPGAAETIRILHVEDSAADAELVQERISETGLSFRIDRVMTRNTFADALARGGYDLILSDYAMPGFDGNAALTMARQQAPELPFIFVTGVLGEEVAVEAMQRGAADFVGKQRLQRLPAAILRALTEARRRRQHRETEAALKASEAHLRFVLDASNLGSWELDVASSRVMISDVCAQHMSLQGRNLVPRSAVRGAVHPADAARVVAAFTQALTTGADLTVECRIPQPDGTMRWVQIRGRASYDALSRPRRMAGITLDTTERREAEERQALLMQEVDHRAKNMLAVVLAMVRLTPMVSRDSFVQTIEGRIAALARAHTLLARSRWEGAELGQLVREEMAPYANAMQADGPSVLLVPEAAQAFAMVLHELTTNAAKHGALSAAGGLVAIRWGLGDPLGERGNQLFLEWHESGGPPVKAPERRGFGTLVIRQNMEHQLAGKADIDWHPDGLQVRMHVPLAAVVRRLLTEKSK